MHKTRTMAEKFQSPAANMLRQTGNELFILPHKLLRPYIAHYTVTFRCANPAVDSLTLIPDASGCMVFTCQENRLDGLFWGATTKTVTVKNDVDEIDFRLFIEFKPGGAHRLTGYPQSELADRILDTEDYNPVLSQAIKNRMEASADLRELICGLDGLFLSMLIKTDASDPAEEIASGVQRRNGNVSVRELSDQTFYSERQLNRIFLRSLGINVKTYSRLLRVNYAVRLMKSSGKAFAKQLYDMGYFDQAHFIHDFKSICGVAPTEYLKNLSDFYNEEYKFDRII